MYIDIVPNRKSPPAILLRESTREKNRVIKRTIANLSECPMEAIEAFRLALKGIKLAPADSFFSVEKSIPYGHVEVILGLMKKLGMDTLISPRPCRERSLVMGMIAQRLISPGSKLATTRLWNSTQLAEELGVSDADENELYSALDWLLGRQDQIEKKLSATHLSQGDSVLFDVSSSSYYGSHCSLAVYGHNRDDQKLPCIVYGLITNNEGCPIAVQTYPGNTSDCNTVEDQIRKIKDSFGIRHVVMVGDRGMLPQTKISEIKKLQDVSWITALRSSAIRELVEAGEVQMSLFDQKNIAELSSELYPGERLVACYNPMLSHERRTTREELLGVTTVALQKIAGEVGRRTQKPMKADEIGMKVGRVLSRTKMKKHMNLDIGDSHFSFCVNEESVAAESRLDGIYIIRSSVSKENMDSECLVRAYKSLGQVEQAFRCIKGLNIRIRPIYHRTDDHVRAHIFLCMLSYYLEWYMRRLLEPVLFEEEGLTANRWQRDPVAKAKPSEKAVQKKSIKQTEEGWPVHSFSSLMADLATRCKNHCRAGEEKNSIRFVTLTEPSPFQKHVYSLLKVVPR